MEKVSIIKVLELNNNAFDLIYYSYWLDSSAIAACLSGTKCPIVSRVHGWDVYEERQKYQYLPLRPFLFKKLKMVYAISQNSMEHLTETYGVNLPMVLSRLGVPNQSIKITSEKKFNKMISISSIISLKRVDYIAKSYADVKGMVWKHYGAGTLQKDIELEFGSEPFQGQLDHVEICKMLGESMSDSFLINVSKYEGIPVSMMEAMSFGIPCIGTNVGGVSEIIEDGYNGFLLSPNPTINEIVNTIQRVLDLSGDKALEMRKAAYKTWEEKFNSETNYKKFADELYSL